MSECEVNRGFAKVLFSIWGIISIASVYKMIEGIVEDNYDHLYTIITSINILIFLMIGISYICKIINPKNEESNNLDKV